VTFAEPNPDVRETGAEVDEFVDTPDEPAPEDAEARRPFERDNQPGSHAPPE
jgi:hypothetical protein